MELIYIIIGFILLIVGANGLVSGASHIAKRLGISELVIGLTIVALGTSMPELVVNLKSALKGSVDLAVANVLGSNIANILLILGVSAMVTPLSIKKNIRIYDIPFMIFVLTVFAVFVLSPFESVAMESLSSSNAFVLVLLGGVFAYYLYFTSQGEDLGLSGEVNHKQHYVMSFLYILGGLTGLIYGGEIVVENAIYIARMLGISERILGITLLALGTSLPELVTSIVAGMRGKTDIAVGNIVGSNILNITFVLGVTGIISPIPFHFGSRIDLYTALFASLLLLLLSYTFGSAITRFMGAILLCCYVSYIYFFVLS